MAKKGQKFNKYTDEFILEVLKYNQNNSKQVTAKKFNIPLGTLNTWKHNKKDINPRRIKGRRTVTNASIEEKYEILKKFIDFLEETQSKK